MTISEYITSAINNLDKKKMADAAMAAARETKRLMVDNPYNFGEKAGSDIRQIADIALAGDVNFELQPDKLIEVVDQLKRVGETGTFVAGTKSPALISIPELGGVGADYAVNGTRGFNDLAANALRHLPLATQFAGAGQILNSATAQKVLGPLRLDQMPDKRFLLNR